MSSHQPNLLEQALRASGPTPWLLGYDANGIQELITASSRPLAMLGASTTIRNFDRDTRHAGTVFAGGGRGIELVASQAAAEARGHELAETFRTRTHGGVLATAAVPFDRTDERSSLLWLHSALEIAKDQAPPTGTPDLVVPQGKVDECADCGMYAAVCASNRRDAAGERVCRRCFDMVDAGRRTHPTIEEKVRSLVDLAPPGQWIAAVSIDGNDLGTFFQGLHSLAEMAAASAALHQLFTDAGRAARACVQHTPISLATGGDDLRLFMAESDLLPYVQKFVSALEAGADSLTRRGLDGLERFGVGIGAVIADPHLPARRLMEHAHDLEVSAKRICRSGEAAARSAIDFAVLTTGFGSIHAPTVRESRAIDIRDLAGQIAVARHLAEIPASQRSQLAGAGPTDPDEFANMLRYQVARSPQWQRWYAACGHDWRDPEIVLEQRPRAVHLDLLRLLESSGGPRAV